MPYQRYTSNQGGSAGANAAQGAIQLLTNFGQNMATIANNKEKLSIDRERVANERTEAGARARLNSASAANQEATLRARELEAEGLREASVSVAQSIVKKNEEIEDFVNQGKTVSAYIAAKQLAGSMSSAHLPDNATPEQINTALMKDSLFAHSPQLKEAQRKFSSLIGKIQLKTEDGVMVPMNDVANSFAMKEDKYNKYVVGQMVPGHQTAASSMFGREVANNEMLDYASTATRNMWREEAIREGIRPDLHLDVKTREAEKMMKDVAVYTAEHPEVPRSEAMKIVSVQNAAKYAQTTRNGMAIAALMTNGASEDEAKRLVNLQNEQDSLGWQNSIVNAEDAIANSKNEIEIATAMRPLVQRRRALSQKVALRKIAKEITNGTAQEAAAAIGGAFSEEAIKNPSSLTNDSWGAVIASKFGFRQDNAHDETRNSLLIQIESLKKRVDNAATTEEEADLNLQYATARRTYDYLLDAQDEGKYGSGDTSVAAGLRSLGNKTRRAFTKIGDDGYIADADDLLARRSAEALMRSVKTFQSGKSLEGFKSINRVLGELNPSYFDDLEDAELEALNQIIDKNMDFTNLSKVRINTRASVALPPTEATGADFTHKLNSSK